MFARGKCKLTPTWSIRTDRARCASTRRGGHHAPVSVLYTLLGSFWVLRPDGSGKVMLVQFKQDGRVYAMKMLRKEAVIRRNQVEHTRTERDVLAWVSHPFIVQLHYAFQTRKKLYFVLE